MFSPGREIGAGAAAAAAEIGGGGGGGKAACEAAAAGACGGAAGLKRMIWAARRVVLEGGRPAPWCGGRAYRDMSVGRMAGLRSASQRAGSSCRAGEFCAHLRADERSFRAAFERRREGSAWLEATRKAVCMALFGGILIFSVLQRLAKFCAARRGAAMV
jgi:hypothetical protein